MFTYCLNNPVEYADATGRMVEETEEEGFKPVGAGIQVEVDLGCSTFGFEIIVYWDVKECTNGSAVLAVYVYGGGGVNGYDDCLGSITATVADNIALLLSGKEDSIAALANIIKAKYSASVSGLILLGNEYFTSVDSYEGVFLSFSGSVHHLKGGVAVSSNCIAVSLGGTTSSSPSWGVSATHYSLRGYVQVGYPSKGVSQVSI